MARDGFPLVAGQAGRQVVDESTPARTNRSSELKEGLVSFSSAIVINGPVIAGLVDFRVESRKGLLEGGWEVDDADCGAGSSKGEAGLLGSGDAARLRKGLLLERLIVRPGEGWSDEAKSKSDFLLAQSDSACPSK